MPPLFDRRLMERMMREALGNAGVDDARDPELAEAEELVFQAYESDDFEERLQLASEAIELCPHCAEAFVCLAEMAPSAQHAVTMYQLGVEAGEHALGGRKGMAGYEGHFWSSLDTRPYMRARLGLAQSLWAVGKRDDAVAHCQELLRLNPDDNQGVRYLLCSMYCDLGRDQELQQLLDEYGDDGSAEWFFSRALLAFRRQGDSPEACELLRQAHEGNPYVAEYMLGNRTLPAETPPYIEPGGETEAIAYAGQFLTAWRNAPGSMSWMRRTLRIEVPEGPPVRRSSLKHLIAIAEELPLADGEVWQVDVVRTEMGGPNGEPEGRPWTLIVTCPQANELLVLEAFEEERQPTSREVLTSLLEVMQDPHDEQPRRPEILQMRRKGFLKNWQTKLAPLGIHCELNEQLDHIQEVLERLESVAAFSDCSTEDLERRIHEIGDLPQNLGEVWQADVRRLATWINEDGLPQRPSGALVASRSEDLILAQRVSLEAPHASLLCEAVLAAIVSPAVGPPHLPGVVEVASDEICQVLQQRLGPLGVDCKVEPHLEQLDFIYGELEEGLAGTDGMKALIDTPGVTPDHVAGFFDAAARFYQQQPWRHVPGDQPICIRCSRFQTDTWYGVVMGQSGMTLGLALYEDLKVLQSILREDDDADRRHSGLSVMFGEPFEISVRDLDAAEKNGWPIAGPEAYPLIVRINPGMAVRPPLAWELELTEACLRAIPGFLRREANTEARMVVPTSSGELDVSLSWLQ